MTVAAKGIIAAFYGNGPRLWYWNSCSTGGRQGLMEAQRFPADYDGIIAGAPVYERTRQLIWELWIAQAVHKDEASYIPPAKYPIIHRAALAMCDARDGVDRRPDREPHHLQVRSRGARVQQRRCAHVPDPGAGGSRRERSTRPP